MLIIYKRAKGKKKISEKHTNQKQMQEIRIMDYKPTTFGDGTELKRSDRPLIICPNPKAKGHKPIHFTSKTFRTRKNPGALCQIPLKR